MISDDLVSLFRPSSAPSPFVQGVMVGDIGGDGSNTVNVAGTLLTDLPILNGGDTVNLADGDVVVLMRLGGSWAILGRVIIPGGAAIATAAVGFGGVGTSVHNFAVTTTSSAPTGASLDVAVPVWANTATVTALATVSVQNTTASNDFLFARTVINGTGGGENFVGVPAGAWGGATSHAIRTAFTVTPGGTFSIEGRCRSQNATWTAQSTNTLNLDATVIFTKS